MSPLCLGGHPKWRNGASCGFPLPVVCRLMLAQAAGCLWFMHVFEPQPPLRGLSKCISVLLLASREEKKEEQKKGYPKRHPHSPLSPQWGQFTKSLSGRCRVCSVSRKFILLTWNEKTLSRGLISNCVLCGRHGTVNYQALLN